MGKSKILTKKADLVLVADSILELKNTLDGKFDQLEQTLTMNKLMNRTFSLTLKMKTKRDSGATNDEPPTAFFC